LDLFSCVFLWPKKFKASRRGFKATQHILSPSQETYWQRKQRKGAVVEVLWLSRLHVSSKFLSEGYRELEATAAGAWSWSHL
jgi:ribosomal protein L20